MRGTGPSIGSCQLAALSVSQEHMRPARNSPVLSAGKPAGEEVM